MYIISSDRSDADLLVNAVRKQYKNKINIKGKIYLSVYVLVNANIKKRLTINLRFASGIEGRSRRYWDSGQPWAIRIPGNTPSCTTHAIKHYIGF